MGKSSSLSSVRILPLPGTECQTLSSAACSSVEPDWEMYPIHSVDEQGVCTCPKRERCQDPGKHPATDSGFNDASSDPRRLEALFSGRAGANVGLRTGRGSGVCVIDFDPRHGSSGSRRKLEAEHGKFPDTREHATGGGGTHLFYALPEGLGWVRSMTLAPGVELKADGAGVVLPPSNHASGGVYRVLSAGPLAPVPAWVLERALKPKLEVLEGEGQSTRPTESRFELPKRIYEGTRNRTLYRYACSLRAHGWDYAAILAGLRRANEERCVPPLDDDEIQRVAGSAASYPKGNASTAGPEVLQALDCIEAMLWERAWPGMGGKSNRSVMMTLVKLGRQHGTLIPAGVRVSIATRALAEAAQMSHRSLMRAVRRLRKSGMLRKDDANRGPTEAGAFVLVLAPATRAPCHHSTTPLGPRRGRVTLELPSC